MQSVRFVGVAKSVGLGLASVGAPRSGAVPKGVAVGGQWAKARLPFWPERHPVGCGQWAKVRLPSGEPIGR